MDVNQYSRLLELLLLKTRSGKKSSGYSCVTSYSHGNNGEVNLYISVRDFDTKDEIAKYEYPVPYKMATCETLDPFNDVAARLEQILLVRTWEDKFIRRCTKCYKIEISKSKRHGLCFSCLSELSNIELLDQSYGNAKGFVYLIMDRLNMRLKIGTSKDPHKRLLALQTGNSGKLELLTYFPGNSKLERQYHKTFAAHHSHGEWFIYSNDIIDEFHKVTKQSMDREYRKHFSITS